MARNKYHGHGALEAPAVPEGPVLECYCQGCTKILPGTGTCTVYRDPIKKTAAERGGHLGCAFSPVEEAKRQETYFDANPRRRVGQQKQAKRKAR